jgi:hypothetical protein
MINKALFEISRLIDSGKFDEANVKTEELYEYAKSEKNESKKAVCIFNIAGFFIDIGHLTGNNELCKNGYDLLNESEHEILNVVPKSEYYYDLANAKSNMISIIYGEDVNFNNIEELIELKNIYWKAFKENRKEEKRNFEIRVNLANSLKRQFRISEALRNYDEVLSSDESIFQANINRSESLKMLNSISNTYSAKLIKEIINGYSVAAESKIMPPQFVENYNLERDKNIKILESLGFDYVNREDDEGTLEEYENLSDYRKYCVDRKLTLSEHGLYCACSGSARDNLTIPLTNVAIGGDFVPRMEAVLNRIKSEFSLARLNYYEYFNATTKIEFNYEDCYTNLLNDEILGVSIEKLRSSFRICFGILDKIAMAICDLYNIENKNNVYFHNFWRLDEKDNRQKYESVKNPGLLALYSIATDLNSNKNGEWACFKDWRNALEHGLLIIYEDDSKLLDPYNSLKLKNEIVKVKLSEFIAFIDELLQLTRSAIFSYVFSVREYAIAQHREGIIIKFDRKNT